jgi:hypothetical protein
MQKSEQQSKGPSGAVPTTPRRKNANPVSPTGLPRSPARASNGNTGIAQAKMLVQSILNQVTMNDSPPINDLIITNNADAYDGNSSGKDAPPKPKGRGAQQDNSGGASSSNSLANTTITSKSTHQFSRQQHMHVLPTIHSPAPYRHNGLTIDAPSPTAAEMGDAMPFLPSPSFANSHISQDSSHLSNFSFERTSLPTSVSIHTPRTEVLPKPPPYV